MLRRLMHLFDYLFRRRRLEDELDEELRSSFEMLVDRFIARGLTSAEARRAARLEFEGLEQVKESVRDSLIGSATDAVIQDLRYAWRGLRQRPAFAAIALITLTLGMGINAAVFSVFYAVLLRPLPYDHPEQLAVIWGNFRTRGTARVAVSGEIFREIEQRQRSLTAVAGIWVTPPRTFTGNPPEQIKNAFVTPNFFDVLGVRAVKGRTFAGEDEGGPALVLADGFFRRRFGLNPDAIGKPVQGQGSSVLIGVLPANFQLHFLPEANVPADVQAFQAWGRDFRDGPNYIVRVVARLNPGFSITQAQSDLNRVADEIRATVPQFAGEDLHFIVTSMQADAYRDVQPALTALFAGGTFVLLIGCVNVTSLLLARASDRRREIALRLALGASRARIFRQLLAEAGLLSAMGGIAGTLAGWAGFRALLLIRPERLARLDDATLIWPVLAFAGSVSIVTALVLALAPLVQSFHVEHGEVFRSRSAGWTRRLHHQTGRALVVGEMMLAFVLVIGATLTARTLFQIERVRPGFEPRQLLTFQLPGIRPWLLAEWEARFASLDGVDGAGAVSHLPFDTTLGNWYGEYRIEPVADNRPSSLTADYRAVTPGYLPAMGVRLLEGRYFDSRDRAGAPDVVIVDESLARSSWPGESAIGKIIDAEHMAPGGTPFRLLPSTVVGVVEHVRNHSMTKEVRVEIYSPFEQNTRGGYPQAFVLRTHVVPLSLVPAVRALVKERDPNVAIDKIRPMTDYVDREIAPVGFTAVLAVIFGTLALLLAATGIYGVLNFQISRRLPEMGIRMALGAGTGDLLKLVLIEGVALTALGILCGGVAVRVAATWLASLLYGISADDPLSYGLALVLLPAAALLACWFPARRAASANPAQIIREG